MTDTVKCVRHHSHVGKSNPSDRTVLSCGEPPPHFEGATVGRDIAHVLARLGNAASIGARDLVAISMGVTAADTFVDRAAAADGWCRVMRLVVPVENAVACGSIRTLLEEALGFLSGDMWEIEFVSAPHWHLPAVQNVLPLASASCAALFSGGLDSAIGALDALAGGQRPVLVSHAYPKDASKQGTVMAHLPPGFLHLAFNADPRCPEVKHDVSMRTRSFNFLAVGAAVADDISRTKGVDLTDLLVPENGFIALNPPLTRRRLGSHSTRTTHPHFLSLYQSMLDGLGIRARITNPYRAMTKGEMIGSCKDEARLRALAPLTVSCGSGSGGTGNAGSACLASSGARRSCMRAGLTRRTTRRLIWCKRFPNRDAGTMCSPCASPLPSRSPGWRPGRGRLAPCPRIRGSLPIGSAWPGVARRR